MNQSFLLDKHLLNDAIETQILANQSLGAGTTGELNGINSIQDFEEALRLLELSIEGFSNAMEDIKLMMKLAEESELQPDWNNALIKRLDSLDQTCSGEQVGSLLEILQTSHDMIEEIMGKSKDVISILQDDMIPKAKEGTFVITLFSNESKLGDVYEDLIAERTRLFQFFIATSRETVQAIHDTFPNGFEWLEPATATPEPSPTPITSPTPGETGKLSELIVNPQTLGKSLRPRIVTVTANDEKGSPVSDTTINADTNSPRIHVNPSSAITGSDGTAQFNVRFDFFSRNGEVVFSAGQLSVVVKQE